MPMKIPEIDLSRYVGLWNVTFWTWVLNCRPGSWDDGLCRSNLVLVGERGLKPSTLVRAECLAGADRHKNTRRRPRIMAIYGLTSCFGDRL